MRRSFVFLVPLAALLYACPDDGIGRAYGVLEVSPESVNYGEVPLAFAETRTIELKNVGIAALDVELRLEGATDDLRLSATKLAVGPGRVETVNVTWQPTTMVLLESTLVITTDSEETPGASVPLSGTPLERPFTVSPDPVDFARVRTGRTVEKQAVVTNHTSEPITLSIGDPNDGNTSGFALASAGTVTLPAKGTATIEVSFTPQRLGVARDRIELQGDCQITCRVNLAVAGEGVDSSLSCAPAPLAFGKVNPSTCVDRVLTCTNLLELPVSIEEVAITPPIAEFVLRPLSLPVLVTGDASTEIEVSYCPTTLDSHQSDLVITAREPDVGQRSLTVPVVGAGGGPDIRVTPADVSLGGAVVGGESLRNVLVENVGQDLLSVSELLIDPPDAPFAVNGDPSFDAGPGGSETIELAFRPIVDGEATAALVIRSNDPDEPEVRVGLRAVGVPNQPCSLEVLPADVAFGLVGTGERATRTVVFRAAGTTACVFFEPALEDGTGPFSLDGILPASGTIDPGSSYTFTIAYEPAVPSGTAGDDDALVVDVPNGGGLIRVPIHGLAAPVDLVVHPNPIDFGTIGLDYTRERTLTVYNVGTAQHMITDLGFLTGSSSDFSMTSTPALPFTLAPGESRSMDLAYSTAAAGPDRGTLAVTSASLPGPLVVDLSGAGGDDPCGHIAGRICAPDGSDSVGARVMVETATGLLIETTTDENGNFYLYCLPPGQTQIDVARGHFRAISYATVTNGQTTQLPDSVCLEGGSVEIAVVTGAYDTVEDILGSLSLDFDLHDGMAGGLPLVLTDTALLNSYDILFLNCGFNDFGVRDPVIAQNLRDFVENGGSIYASDWAYDAVETSYPQYIDFYDDDTLPDVAQQGFNTLLTGTVLDPAILDRLGGQALVTVTFSGGYALIENAAPNAQVHVAGESQGPGSGLKPLLVSFDPPGPTAGKVIYTSFHNAQVIVDPGMRIVLEFLVFAL